MRVVLHRFRWEDKEESFAISSFCVVLAHKNTLFFDCEKRPVFNFWETHKSLPLLSYRRQNWKQMLHSPLLSFELANYGVVKKKKNQSVDLFTPSLFSPLSPSFLPFPHSSCFLLVFLTPPFLFFFFFEETEGDH